MLVDGEGCGLGGDGGHFLTTRMPIVGFLLLLHLVLLIPLYTYKKSVIKTWWFYIAKYSVQFFHMYIFNLFLSFLFYVHWLTFCLEFSTNTSRYLFYCKFFYFKTYKGKFSMIFLWVINTVYSIKFNIDNIFTYRQTIPSFAPINSMALFIQFYYSLRV